MADHATVCLTCQGQRVLVGEHFGWQRYERTARCPRCDGSGLEPSCENCGVSLSDDAIESGRAYCWSCYGHGCVVCRSGNKAVAIVDGQEVCDSCLAAEGRAVA